jgi:hypothetical protein
MNLHKKVGQKKGLGSNCSGTVAFNSHRIQRHMFIKKKRFTLYIEIVTKNATNTYLTIPTFLL